MAEKLKFCSGRFSNAGVRIRDKFSLHNCRGIVDLVHGLHDTMKQRGVDPNLDSSFATIPKSSYEGGGYAAGQGHRKLSSATTPVSDSTTSDTDFGKTTRYWAIDGATGGKVAQTDNHEADAVFREKAEGAYALRKLLRKAKLNVKKSMRVLSAGATSTSGEGSGTPIFTVEDIARMSKSDLRTRIFSSGKKVDGEVEEDYGTNFSDADYSHEQGGSVLLSLRSALFGTSSSASSGTSTSSRAVSSASFQRKLFETLAGSRVIARKRAELFDERSGRRTSGTTGTPTHAAASTASPFVDEAALFSPDSVAEDEGDRALRKLLAGRARRSSEQVPGDRAARRNEEVRRLVAENEAAYNTKRRGEAHQAGVAGGKSKSTRDPRPRDAWWHFDETGAGRAQSSRSELTQRRQLLEEAKAREEKKRGERLHRLNTLSRTQNAQNGEKTARRRLAQSAGAATKPSLTPLNQGSYAFGTIRKQSCHRALRTRRRSLQEQEALEGEEAALYSSSSEEGGEAMPGGGKTSDRSNSVGTRLPDDEADVFASANKVGQDVGGDLRFLAIEACCLCTTVHRELAQDGLTEGRQLAPSTT
eukprot:g14868.t1